MKNNMELNELDQQFEKEFRAKVEEFAYYQGNRERYTLDGEWSENELKESVTDEAMKILQGDKTNPGWLVKTSGRAKHDKDLEFPEFLANKLIDAYDLVEQYNKLVDKHRNDPQVKFGIHYFDEWSIKEMTKILKDNLVTN